MASDNLSMFFRCNDLDYFYGKDFYNNLDIMHDYIYNKNIDIHTVISNEIYGGNSLHSGCSFYLMKHTIKRYHDFLRPKVSNPNILRSVRDYTFINSQESPPSYDEINN